MKNIHLISLLLIVVIGVLGYRVSLALEEAEHHYNSPVHVHADFAVYVNEQKIDFSQQRYQSSVGNEKSKVVHVHDGNGNIVHRHDEEVTFAQFLSSLNFTLTNDCLTVNSGEQYCENDTTAVTLYVNSTPVDDAVSYVPQEEDRILLAVAPKDEDTTTRLASVTNDACIPSGTCPERGTPPVETCGLTCDVTLSQSKITLKEIVMYVFTGHY